MLNSVVKISMMSAKYFEYYTTTLRGAVFNVAHNLLDQYYPARVVTRSSRDPSYVTPGIKSVLRRKNKLMRSGERHSSHERSYPTAGPVSTGMGDRLWGIPSRYVTSQLGQLSLASLRGR